MRLPMAAPNEKRLLRTRTDTAPCLEYNWTEHQDTIQADNYLDNTLGREVDTKLKTMIFYPSPPVFSYRPAEEGPSLASHAI